MRKTSGSSRIAPTIASRTASRYVISLGIHVLQGRVGIGVGFALRLLEGFLDPLPALVFQGAPLVLFEQAGLFQLHGEALDGVLLAPRGDLLARPVEVRVALGVAEVAVGDRLEQGRSLAGAGTFEGPGGGVVDLVEVGAADRDARHAVGGGPIRYVLDGRSLLDAHGHPVLVVLAQEDHGQLPDRRQVEGLVEDALVGGALAEEAERRVVLAAPLEGPARAAGYAHAPADYAVGAEHPGPHVGDVHRAALAVAVAGGLAEQLRGHAVHVEAERDGVPVAAVGGGDHVPLLQGGYGPDGDGLLPDVEVRRPVDLPLGVEVVYLLVEGAAEEHLPQEVHAVTV